MPQATQQINQKLLHRISGVLTEISHNIHLVRPTWPEGKFSIWINGFLDLYERADNLSQKTRTLEMLVEDVELFREQRQQEDAATWQTAHPFTPKDRELEGILLRIASIIRLSEITTLVMAPTEATVH